MSSAMSRLKRFVQLEQTEEMEKTKGMAWTNKDLAPNPPETRRWNAWSFFLFQVSGVAKDGGVVMGRSS
jgi:NCS1 family nucleobase:cation symporter-1